MNQLSFWQVCEVGCLKNPRFFPLREGRMVLCDHKRKYAGQVRVAVIPLTSATLKKLADKTADAFSGSYDGHLHRDDIQAMLCSLGFYESKDEKETAKNRQED